MPNPGCSTCSWHCPSYADTACRERRRTKRCKRSWHLSNERWPASARASSSYHPAVARSRTEPTVWNLNGGDGLELRGDAAGCRSLASMHYRILPTDPDKYDVEQARWRVTTSAYLYEFRTPDNAKLWAMHWHPAGKSHATFPAPPPLHRPPRRALRHAATDPRVGGSVVHRDGRGAAESPVAHRAGRVRGHPPALPIVVGGPATAGSKSVTPVATARERRGRSTECSPRFP